MPGASDRISCTARMTSTWPLVLFADFDRVVLDSRGCTLPNAIRALGVLCDRHVSVVFCSGRTRAQLELTQQELALSEPFICENGAAIFVPHRYFGFDVPNAREVAGYEAVEFGRPYPAVVDVLRRTAERVHVALVGFSDMSVAEVADDCDLPLLQARLAKLREYEELFRIVDRSAGARIRLFKALRAAGLRCLPAGRYDCLGAAVDASLGVSLLSSCYRQAFGDIGTVGVVAGETEEHPWPVDYAVRLDDGPGSGNLGIETWVESMIEQIDGLRRTELRAGNRRSRTRPEHYLRWG